MKKAFVASVLAAVLLAASPPAWAGDCPGGRPEIKKASFVMTLHNRTLDVDLKYACVAGDIDQARFVLTVGLVIYDDIEMLQPLYVGKRRPAVLNAAAQVTSGSKKLSIVIPDNVDLADGDNLTGFGVRLVDQAGRRSLPIFQNVELAQIKD